MDDSRDDLLLEADDDDLDEDSELDPLEESTGVTPRSLDPDAILDSLMPQSIDWRGTVRRHPIGSMAAVGLIGYLVGRSRGGAIVSGLSAGLSAALMRQLSDVLEGDFFDF